MCSDRGSSGGILATVPDHRVRRHYCYHGLRSTGLKRRVLQP